MCSRLMASEPDPIHFYRKSPIVALTVTLLKRIVVDAEQFVAYVLGARQLR